MSEIENDEPFIRKVESLICPAEVSDLIFFSSLKKFIPPALFKRVLYNTSKRYPRIGFVIEPYCLFLFFRLRHFQYPGEYLLGEQARDLPHRHGPGDRDHLLDLRGHPE
jgi:hypothetical protein